jgi:hypothetical protein
MKALLLILVLTILLLSSYGCGVRPPIEGRRDPFVPPQVSIAENSLKHATAVGDPRVSRDPSGLLVVTVPIRSETDQDLHVDYSVTFLDSAGHQLSETSWFTKTLTSKVPDEITVTSMSPLAGDFRMRFRWAR